MKKETRSNKENNKAIWEEFVSKNKINKKFSSSSIKFKNIKSSEYFTVEELTSIPKQYIIPKSFEKNNNVYKTTTSFIPPKIDIDIEKNKLRRIKNGKVTIDGILDLHGFSLKEAEDRLKLYVGDSVRLRKRFLLIITGKGINSKPNIHGKTLTIKSEVKNWLLDSFYDDKVQYISKALDRHGGEGAYYFFLKKSQNIFS